MKLLLSSPISQTKLFFLIKPSKMSNLLMVHCSLLFFSLHACRCSTRLLQEQPAGIHGSVLFSSAKETRSAIKSHEYSRIKGNYILTSYCCGENTMKEKISKDKGKNVALPSPTKVIVHDMTNIEDEEWQLRKILEYSEVASDEDSAKESMGADHQENNAMGEEDTLVMDYAQPHCKSPIHNKRP